MIAVEEADELNNLRPIDFFTTAADDSETVFFKLIRRITKLADELTAIKVRK